MCGGNPVQHTTSENVTSTLPPYAEPYWHDVMQRAAAASAEPYTPYQGQRIAQFSPAEQEAMNRLTSLGMSGTNPNLTQAGNIAAEVGGQMPGQRDSQYMAGSRESGFAPSSRTSGFTAQSRGFRGFDDEDTRRDSEYQATSRDVGFEPGQLNDQQMLNSYMSPYMQSVVDIQKREAMRDADKRHRDIGLDAAGAGQLGGYGQAILQSETERDLGQRLDDLQAEGQQAAFSDAKQSYEQDRAARQALEQFQQSQFGLNADQRALQEQLLQSQFGLNIQGLSTEEQLAQAQWLANQQQRATQEQFAQSQFGLNAEQQALAEQLAQSQFGMNQSNQQAMEQLRQGQFGMNQQGFLQGQQNRLAAANQMADYGGMQQSMELERLAAMMGAGNQQRDMAQRSLDMGYGDFLRQQAYPWEQASMMNNMLQGNAMAPGRTSDVYGQGATGTQQALGGITSLLGAYNMGGGGKGG